MRVHMNLGYTDTHPETGIKTVYHGGHAYDVSDELGVEMRAAGVCLLADDHNEPIPDPEPEPAPEIQDDPEPSVVDGDAPALTPATLETFPDAGEYLDDESTEDD